MRHGLAFVFLKGFAGLLRLLPLSIAVSVGAGLGRLVGVFARADRRRLQHFLTLVPHPPTPGECFADLGRRVAELICARRLLPRWVIDEAALAAWEAAQSQGRGVLVATAHFGNWELMAAALAHHGLPFVAIGARRQSGPLFRWLEHQRAALGVRVLAPGGGARGALRHLQAGGTVALFVDQATREKSRPIVFLGRPAPTPITLERLQAATGAAVLFVWSEGAVIRAEALDSLEAITARLETLIHQHPAAWIGLHDRWRA